MNKVLTVFIGLEEHVYYSKLKIVTIKSPHLNSSQIYKVTESDPEASKRSTFLGPSYSSTV